MKEREKKGDIREEIRERRHKRGNKRKETAESGLPSQQKYKTEV